MKAGRRRNKRKHPNTVGNSTVSQVNEQLISGTPESTYLRFVRTFKNWVKDTPYQNISIDFPSFDFGSYLDIGDPNCLQEVIDAESRPISDYLSDITILPSNRAYVFRHTNCNVIIITFGMNVLPSEVGVGFTNPAMIFIEVDTDSWTGISCPEALYEFVILAEYLMQNRQIDYLSSGGSHLQRLNTARSKHGKKAFPEPKTIYLHKTVRTGGGSGNSRSLSHEYQVPPFKRRYKQPILNGPNKGKMIIDVSGHKRGIGLPPKPSSAETMQYRVLP